MIVKDDLDCRVRWVGGVEEFEELDNLAGPVNIDRRNW
jgi:hypothetical protein